MTGDNGLLQKATTAKQVNQDAKELELIKLAVSAARVNGEGTLTIENLNNELQAIFNDNDSTTDEIKDGWSYKSYKINKDGEVDNLLPKEYQQVKYIELDNISPCKSYIKTNIEISKVSTIKCKYSYRDFVNKQSPMILSTINSNNITDGPWICTNGYSRGDISINPIIKKEENLKPTEFTITTNSKSNNILKVGGWSDNVWTPIASYYFIKIYDRDNIMVFHGLPCYSKDNNSEIGLYDTVEGEFYRNQGTGKFVAGPEV